MMNLYLEIYKCYQIFISYNRDSKEISQYSHSLFYIEKVVHIDIVIYYSCKANSVHGLGIYPYQEYITIYN